MLDVKQGVRPAADALLVGNHEGCTNKDGEARHLSCCFIGRGGKNKRRMPVSLETY